MKENFPEILAPAGSEEQLVAAVRSGADAVYLAADTFNARRNAKNFAGDDLDRAVAYCRERGVKAYAAVNTLITDDEMPALLSLTEHLARAGIDGVIVQDLAAATVFRLVCPEIPLHASTQMTVHNRAGVRLLKQLGFSRFVPARELTLDEIAALAAQTDLETEVFVHGALCMSVSGCCYLSSMLGGRSGNRGLCAQCCRLNFRAGSRTHALSLKDMSYIDHIRALTEIGVRSLKIEGRMKRPEYAAAAVTACRQARSGEPYDRETLKNVFSRSGFTDGYLTGKRNLSLFGFRTREDVTAATGKVLSSLRALYAQERRSVPVTAALTVSLRETRLTVSDGVHTVCAVSSGGERPEKRPLSRESAEKSLSKTGGTPYRLTSLDFQNPDGLCLSAAVLNGLRRDSLDKLAAERRKPRAPLLRPFVSPASPLPKAGGGSGGVAVRFARAEQCFDGDFARVFLPVDEILSHPDLVERYRDRLCAETPALLFPADEDRLVDKLLRLRALGVQSASADNIGQIQLLRENSFAVIGGMGLNILNSTALSAYAELGLTEATVSFELSAKKIAALRTLLPLTVPVYGRLPLMKYRCCPLQSETGCAGCPGHGELIDRMGVRFPVRCENRRYSVLYNSVPLDVCNRTFPAPLRRLLYFTDESPAACLSVFRRAKDGGRPAEPHTTGLYFRELY